MQDALRRWLGADAQVVEVLSEAELAELHAALVAARKRQAAALAAASEEALRQMPARLRSTVARIVGR